MKTHYIIALALLTGVGLGAPGAEFQMRLRVRIASSRE
jgi:hypothetical protein